MRHLLDYLRFIIFGSDEDRYVPDWQDTDEHETLGFTEPAPDGSTYTREGGYTGSRVMRHPLDAYVEDFEC